MRALTYTEMMNGGRQQMDEAEHAREQQLQQRVEDLEKNVDQLEQALKKGKKNPPAPCLEPGVDVVIKGEVTSSSDQGCRSSNRAS